jgi:hypothetical protein
MKLRSEVIGAVNLFHAEPMVRPSATPGWRRP